MFCSSWIFFFAFVLIFKNTTLKCHFSWLLRYLASSSFSHLAFLPPPPPPPDPGPEQVVFIKLLPHSAHPLCLLLLNALSLGCGALGWIKHSYLCSDHSQVPPLISKSLWSKEGLERWEIVLEFEFVLSLTAGDCGQPGPGCWAEAYILGSVSVHGDKQTLIEPSQ